MTFDPYENQGGAAAWDPAAAAASKKAAEKLFGAETSEITDDEIVPDEAASAPADSDELAEDGQFDEFDESDESTE